MQFDRSFKFVINDDEWTCFLITEEEGIELDEIINGDEADTESFVGMVTFAPRCLYLAESGLEKSTVAHELFHIVVYYLHLNSADLDTSQFEEVLAVWIENEVDKFIRTRDKLYEKFKTLENSGKK